MGELTHVQNSGNVLSSPIEKQLLNSVKCIYLQMLHIKMG